MKKLYHEAFCNTTDNAATRRGTTMANNVTARVLRDYYPYLPDREEVFQDVLTVGDVRERLGLQKGDYKAMVNKDFAGDGDTIDSKNVVTFAREAEALRHARTRS